LKLNYPH